MSSRLVPGRVPRAQRLVRAARHLYEGGTWNTLSYAKSFGISSDTAEDDMLVLQSYLPVSIVDQRPGYSARRKTLRLHWRAEKKASR